MHFIHSYRSTYCSEINKILIYAHAHSYNSCTNLVKNLISPVVKLVVQIIIR
jgi:hypothetical protein